MDEKSDNVDLAKDAIYIKLIDRPYSPREMEYTISGFSEKTIRIAIDRMMRENIILINDDLCLEIVEV